MQILQLVNRTRAHTSAGSGGAYVCFNKRRQYPIYRRIFIASTRALARCIYYTHSKYTCHTGSSRIYAVYNILLPRATIEQCMHKMKIIFNGKMCVSAEAPMHIYEQVALIYLFTRKMQISNYKMCTQTSSQFLLSPKMPTKCKCASYFETHSKYSAKLIH